MSLLVSPSVTLPLLPSMGTAGWTGRGTPRYGCQRRLGTLNLNRADYSTVAAARALVDSSTPP
jgi:hypothetical protein